MVAQDAYHLIVDGIFMYSCNNLPDALVDLLCFYYIGHAVSKVQERIVSIPTALCTGTKGFMYTSKLCFDTIYQLEVIGIVLFDLRVFVNIQGVHSTPIGSSK